MIKIDVTKLAIDALVVGFLVAALIVTFVVAFTVVEEGPPTPPAATTPAAPTTPPGTPGATIAPQPPSPQEIEDLVTEAVNGVIETQMGDNFFTRNNLKAPLGEALTINFTNEGLAIHNFRLAGPDGQWNPDDDVVSDPDFVVGGATAVVEWTPVDPGTYTFRCDFHPTEQGGQIVIE